jgi:hypothetical protein
MFQYSIGRKLSLIHGARLKVDISAFEKDPLRSYMLGNFNINVENATQKEIQNLCDNRSSRIKSAFSSITRLLNKEHASHIRERDTFLFDEKVLHMLGDLYLEGYWQTEKYFADIGRLIRDEFEVTPPLIGKNKELFELIKKTNSVSIHIRRGDYVTAESARNILGPLDAEYYYRCVDYINNRVNNPHYFLFSDDPNWVFSNFKIHHPVTIIDNNSIDECYEDLRLMKQCKHHIIANSTFSWWGAWLSPIQDKIVLAPKNWHADKNRKTHDLIPTSWTRI